MDLFHGEPDAGHVIRVAVRLATAAALGGAIGWERLRERKMAGIRTHAMVALGAAVFTLTPLEHGISAGDLSRVIQGVATGIGFLGAGTILQIKDEHRIEGLTTAASIWVTAAIGMAIGAGWLWPAACAVALGLAVLMAGHVVEHLARGKKRGD